ncbi:MAG: signal peptidase II, partial [Gemmatimonadota bacterium]|nr:signal peptidase II [Gemmatimonadota bacterium]
NPGKKMPNNKASLSKIGLKSRVRLFLTTVPAVFLADYITKDLVQRTMVPYGETIQVIEGLVKLRFIYNEGIAFGLRFGFAPNWVLITVSSLVALIMVGYFFFSDYHDYPGLFALCLVSGGAFGNLLDRIVNKKVVDFIECGIKDLTWPVFNVADIAVTCGAILLALRLFSEAGKDKKQQED